MAHLHIPARRTAQLRAAALRSQRVSPLVLFGLLLIAVGATGDIAHHALPRELSAALQPLLGLEGIHAHLATFAGMLAILGRVLGRALRP